jgi:FOG: CheY-like receiver
MSVKKILLVDDSAMARRSARQILESAGYAVARRKTALSRWNGTSSTNRTWSCWIW